MKSSGDLWQLALVSRFAGMAGGWAAVVLALQPRLAAADDTRPPVIEVGSCDEFVPGQPVVLWVTLEDDSNLFEPKVFYRRDRQRDWSSAVPERQGDSSLHSATLLTAGGRGPLYFFVESFDEMGNGPSRAGSPDAPLSLTPNRQASPCLKPGEEAVQAAVPPPDLPSNSETVAPEKSAALTATAPPAERSSCQGRDQPVWCKGWFWGVVSGVVVGAAAATYFIATSGDDGEPAGPTSPQFITPGFNVGAQVQ